MNFIVRGIFFFFNFHIQQVILSTAGLVRLVSSAWVVAATELISRLNTGSPVLVPVGRLAQSLPGFKFAYRWRWPPGLWYAGVGLI